MNLPLKQLNLAGGDGYIGPSFPLPLQSPSPRKLPLLKFPTNLAETTHLKSQTDNLEIDQLSKGLPGEIQPVIQRLKFFINRTCLAKQEVHMIMEAIDKMVSFQISVMRMIHSSLKESSF